MSKLKMNPDFEGEEELFAPEEGDEEEKETEDEESSEEGDQSEASADEEPGDTVGDEVADAEAIAERKRALEGLEREEQKLNSDLAALDEEIEARKQAIVEKRKARREAKFSKREQPVQEEEIDLSDIDEEDIQRMEKVLKARGFVPKSELEAERFKEAQAAAENAFYEKYPQYKPENDKDDLLFGALQKEINLYAKPKSPADISRILERAHKQVEEQFPARFTKRSQKAEADTASKRAKMNLAGTGAGNSGPSTKKASGENLTKAQAQALKDGGFDDLFEI